MSQVRRSVGAFVLAAVVATGMVLTPRQADALTLPDALCAKIREAIAYFQSLESLNPLQDAALQKLLIAESYCPQQP